MQLISLRTGRRLNPIDEAQNLTKHASKLWNEDAFAMGVHTEK